MNRVVPASRRQQAPKDRTIDNLNNYDERQPSPTPLVQDLLFLKESDIQLLDDDDGKNMLKPRQEI